MGLQSPMESRKSENARLQAEPDDGNTRNLGRELYARHLSMSSVAGPRSAAWQALRLETFGTNRLPMLARFSQRWGRAAVVPASKGSAYEWYIARAVSTRSLYPKPTSSAKPAVVPAASAIVPAFPESSVVSRAVDADPQQSARTNSLAAEIPDQRVEWGPPIFQAGSSGRKSGSKISRDRAREEESAAGISTRPTTRGNEQSPLGGDMPGLLAETPRAESQPVSKSSGESRLARSVAPPESKSGALAVRETGQRIIRRVRQESIPPASANAESELTAGSEQTSAAPILDSPVSADTKPVHLQDEPGIRSISLNQLPTAGLPFRHVTRVAHKSATLIAKPNNKDRDVSSGRKPIETQTQVLRKEAGSGVRSGASTNRGLQNVGEYPLRHEDVSSLEAGEACLSDPVKTVAVTDNLSASAIPLMASENPTGSERHDLQHEFNPVHVQYSGVARLNSEAAGGSGSPDVVSEMVAPKIARTISASGVAPVSLKSLIAPESDGAFESTSTSRMESSARLKPTTLLTTAHRIFHAADLPGAGESKGVTELQGVDTPTSEVTLFRASARDTIEEKQAHSSLGMPSGELTPRDSIAGKPDQSAMPELSLRVGDSSMPGVLDSSVSSGDRTLVDIHARETATRHEAREPKALAAKIASLVPFGQRRAAAEIHRFSAPNAGPMVLVQRAVASSTPAQPRSSSHGAAVMRTHESLALHVIGETAQVQRAMGAGAPAEAIEGSVPLPHTSAAAQSNSPADADVGLLADRVYQLLLTRLMSERSLRGI